MANKTKNHIQIPKSILEGFSDKNNGYKVCRMDCAGHIDFELPKNCNIGENFYSENVETNVLANVESDFGQVKRKIIKSIKQSVPICLTKKETDSIKWFFIISLARQSQLTANQNADASSVTRSDNIAYADSVKSRLFEGLYPHCGFCISVNQTNQNFIVSQNCVFHTMNAIDQVAAMPITPKLLIALVPFEENVPLDTFPIMETDDLKLVDAFNVSAICAEMNANKDRSYKYLYAQKEVDFSRYDILKQLKKGNQ